MSQIDDRWVEIDRLEEIRARCRPEADRLKHEELGPWSRAVANGYPVEEPVEARRRYAELGAELWQARNLEQLRSEVGALENQSRWIQGRMAELDADIARLSADAPTPAKAALNSDTVKSLTRERDALQRRLERIGIPRTVAVEAV